tara:strand:- start:610 stop:900 length:291 start_codon:yes stop_codon:yes gene_type:complete
MDIHSVAGKKVAVMVERLEDQTILVVMGVLEIHPDGVLCRVISYDGLAFFRVSDVEFVYDKTLSLERFGLPEMLQTPLIKLKDRRIMGNVSTKWMN